MNFEAIWELRSKANKVLEPYRARKIKPIDLHLHITVSPDHPLTDFKNYDGLNDIFGVSKFSFSTEDFLLEPEFTLVDATGLKCERCLKWFDDGYESKCFPSLCFRCDRVINMMAFDAMIILFKRVCKFLYEVANAESLD